MKARILVTLGYLAPRAVYNNIVIKVNEFFLS